MTTNAPVSYGAHPSMNSPDSPTETQSSASPVNGQASPSSSSASTEAQPTAAHAPPDSDASHARDAGGPAASPSGGGSAGGAGGASPEGGQDAGSADAGSADASGESDDGPGEGTSAEGGDAAGADAGAPHKKRRRRRRKKHGDAAVAVAGEGAAPVEGEAGDGAPAAEGEAAQAAQGEGDAKDGKKKRRKDRPARPAEPRERPAFNVGDVVFGKIQEIGDDAIFIDLSGKGSAVFDKLELLLPEDVPDQVETDAKKAEAHAESLLSGKPAASSTADVNAAADAAEGAGAAEAVHAADASASSDSSFDVTAEKTEGANESAPASGEVAREHAEHAPAEHAPAEHVPEAAEATEGAEGGGEAAAAAAPQGNVVQLPRVVLEAGAPFVGVVHNDGGRGGLVVLTHHPKRASLAKPAVVAAFKQRNEIFGLVTGVIKGGVEVDVDGIRAFAPGSHMDLRLGSDLHRLVGKRLPFHVTQYAKRGRDVVLSRRAMLEGEARAAREAALAKLQPGQTITGTVRSVVTFGAFIDVGGIEGLVPLTEMSHNRSDGPNDVFKAGAEIEVKVLRVDEKGKVWLSRKATIPDPWLEATKKYAVGSRHTGKVVRLQPFGAFVELESGIDGLIHTADLSVKRIEHPSDVVKVGDPIEVVVASLDGGSHKIGLHPAPAGATADETPQRVQIQKVVKVQVVSIETGGLIVRVLGATGRHARGFIPAGLTGTPRGTELRKPFPPGHQLDAKVIEMDPKRGEVKLSIKAMQEDTERNAYQQYRQQLKQQAKFGTFADLLAKKGPTQK